MPYKISGTKSETARVIVIKESDWSIESNTVVSGSGAYEIESLVSGTKTIVGESNEGEILGYGGVTPESLPILGENWIERSESVDANWHDICWSPELSLFVAIAETIGILMTSPDGINWTNSTLPSGADRIWWSICWSPELTLFVTVSRDGDNNRVMTSPDGINWTLRECNTQSWIGVCWSPELAMFVAAKYGSGTNSVMTSTNGINWTQRNTPSGSSGRCVCWSSELTLFVITRWGNEVITSPDGINWTLRTLPANSGVRWQSVAWGSTANMFVAVASQGTERLMTSPDGINWTYRTVEGYVLAMDVNWIPELDEFIITGISSGCLVSSDGINWTKLQENSVPYYVAYSSELNRLVAVSYTGVGVMTSG